MQPVLRPFQAEAPTELGARTVADVVTWFTGQDRGGTNLAAHVERTRIRELFVRQYGGMSLADCRPLHLLQFINDHHGAESDWTRLRWRNTICRPFNEAAGVGLISRNPFKGLRLPQGNDGRDLTPDEFQALLRNTNAAFRKVLIAMKFSGMRPGELSKLTSADVHLDERCVMLSKHKTSAKTRRPRRIMLAMPLVKLLTGLMPKVAPGTPLFRNSFGGPWRTRALCKNLKKARDEAGLPPDAKLVGARHLFATAAIMNGVGVADLAELMGHASITMSQRYVHLSAKSTHLVRVIDRATGGVRNSSG